MCNHRTYKRRLQRKRQKVRNLTATEVNELMKWTDMFGCKTQSTKTVPEKKDTTMYVDYISSDKHAESSKTNYLLQRASNTKSRIRSDLYRQFGLYDDDAPTTPAELVARITSGKFVLPTEKELELTKSLYWTSASMLTGIRWRDPAVKEDKEGFNAAEKLLETEFQKVQDSAMIDSPDAALLSVQNFDKWTLPA